MLNYLFQEKAWTSDDRTHVFHILYYQFTSPNHFQDQKKKIQIFLQENYVDEKL